ITADIERSAARLRTLLTTFHQEYGLEFEWLRSAGSSDVVIGPLVPWCDICVLGHDSLFTGTSVDREFCERLFFTSVTPIVLVPSQSKVTSLGRRIVVAWDSSRTAARALNDAISLIQKAERATVVHVDSGLQANSTAGLELLQNRLRHHNDHVNVVQVRASQESIATALQAKARELNADLLVAGAYGHSRFKERIFGGVSREILQNMTLPVLMSH
ncbi:MAG TPA: universal stress protein, partial [Steroidobacteraceae bacterium]